MVDPSVSQRLRARARERTSMQAAEEIAQAAVHISSVIFGKANVIVTSVPSGTPSSSKASLKPWSARGARGFERVSAFHEQRRHERRPLHPAPPGEGAQHALSTPPALFDGHTRAQPQPRTAVRCHACARRAAEWALHFFGDNGHAARRGDLALGAERVRREVRDICMRAIKRGGAGARNACARVLTCVSASDNKTAVYNTHE